MGKGTCWSMLGRLAAAARAFVPMPSPLLRGVVCGAGARAPSGPAAGLRLAPIGRADNPLPPGTGRLGGCPRADGLRGEARRRRSSKKHRNPPLPGLARSHQVSNFLPLNSPARGAGGGGAGDRGGLQHGGGNHCGRRGGWVGGVGGGSAEGGVWRAGGGKRCEFAGRLRSGRPSIFVFARGHACSVACLTQGPACPIEHTTVRLIDCSTSGA